jgi:hypothetical protein
MATTQHTVDEAQIRVQIDKLAEAIRNADLEGVKPRYAPDVVSFDVERGFRMLAQKQNGITGQRYLHCSSVRSALRCATSRSQLGVTWPSAIVSTASAEH